MAEYEGERMTGDAVDEFVAGRRDLLSTTGAKDSPVVLATGSMGQVHAPPQIYAPEPEPEPEPEQAPPPVVGLASGASGRGSIAPGPLKPIGEPAPSVFAQGAAAGSAAAPDAASDSDDEDASDDDPPPLRDESDLTSFGVEIDQHTRLMTLISEIGDINRSSTIHVEIHTPEEFNLNREDEVLNDDQRLLWIKVLSAVLIHMRAPNVTPFRVGMTEVDGQRVLPPTSDWHDYPIKISDNSGIGITLSASRRVADDLNINFDNVADDLLISRMVKRIWRRAQQPPPPPEGGAANFMRAVGSSLRSSLRVKSGKKKRKKPRKPRKPRPTTKKPRPTKKKPRPTKRKKPRRTRKKENMSKLNDFLESFKI